MYISPLLLHWLFFFFYRNYTVNYKPDFFPSERFNQFYFQHIKSTQLIFFCCYQMQFFSGTKVHKKVYYPPTTMICFAQKEKVLYERERLWWEEPIHFFELSYLLFRSEWMNLLQYTQSMYKNRVKKDKILFLKFLLFCRLVHDDEIQSRKIENNTNILNFPSPYSADSPRALEIEPYFQNISVVLYPISLISSFCYILWGSQEVRKFQADSTKVTQHGCWCCQPETS